MNAGNNTEEAGRKLKLLEIPPMFRDIYENLQQVWITHKMYFSRAFFPVVH